MDIFQNILDNTVLKSALFSWFIAQFLKVLIEVTAKKNFKTKEDFFLRALFGTGGMPSSHSATIAAVAISIGIRERLDSSIFALAIVLVIIILRDATGVRFSAGKQAEIINRLLEDQYKFHGIKYEKMKEIRGHTPLETFVGVLVGILVSLGINLLNK
ncbi:MAG: divergent PAP2 family protein [Spirochaetes bacterium]|nr:divergent PAP2 family protein [Spirochaetota bacterium]